MASFSFFSGKEHQPHSLWAEPMADKVVRRRKPTRRLWAHLSTGVVRITYSPQSNAIRDRGGEYLMFFKFQHTEFYFLLWFFHPICYLRPSCSCSLLVVTQIWGSHNELFSPLPAKVRASQSYHEKGSALFSPRRLASSHSIQYCCIYLIQKTDILWANNMFAHPAKQTTTKIVKTQQKKKMGKHRAR